jgi:AraC family transcriptional regulator
VSKDQTKWLDCWKVQGRRLAQSAQGRLLRPEPMEEVVRYENFADFYRSGPHGQFQQLHRQVAGLPFRLIRVQQDAHTFVDAGTPDQVLGLTLGGSARTHWGWGDRWRTLQRRERGHFGVSPAHAPGQFDVEGPHRLLLIAWPEQVAIDIFERHGLAATADWGALHDRYHRDAKTFALAGALWRAARDAEQVGGLQAEQLFHDLLLRMHALAHSEDRAPAVSARKLSEPQVRRLDEWIEARLEATVTLSEMAALLSLSEAQLVRAVRVTTGKSPHAYVVSRRVRRACGLLAQGDLPLAEVALASGFSHQSHLHHWFVRAMGMTPGQYRRNIS